jgi:hypothetical protein
MHGCVAGRTHRPQDPLREPVAVTRSQAVWILQLTSDDDVFRSFRGKGSALFDGGVPWYQEDFLDDFLDVRLFLRGFRSPALSVT